MATQENNGKFSKFVPKTLGRKKVKNRMIIKNLSCNDLTMIENEDEVTQSNSALNNSHLKPNLIIHTQLKPEESEDYMDAVMSVIRELKETERNYLTNLTDISSFIAYMEKSKVKPTPSGIAPMPDDLSNGKDLIVFANSRGLLDFHQRCMITEIEKVKTKDDISIICNLFTRRKDDLKYRYGKFCINQPKAEFIVASFEEYFNLVRLALDFQLLPLRSLLMSPIQRVTRYTLLLEEALRLLKKSNEAMLVKLMEEALQHAKEVCEYANDMMIAGRITGFTGEITKQGLLILRGEALCYKKRSSFLMRAKPKDCTIFLFRERIILARKDTQSAFNKSDSFPSFSYWVSYKISKVVVIEIPDSKTSFQLESKDKKNEDFGVVVKCKDENTKLRYLELITGQITQWSQFAFDLENPQRSSNCLQNI